MKKLKQIDIPAEVLRWDAAGLLCPGGITPAEHYCNCIKKGSSPRFAADLVALACGQATVGTGITDDVYIADQNRWGRSILDRMGGDVRAVQRLRTQLARNGYKLKSDDHYVETVARFPGDPQAIVNHGQGLSDLRQNLAKQGRTIKGEIELKGEAKPSKRVHRLHPRIVERIRQQKINENPDLARIDQRALREEIVTKHGAKAE